MPDTRDSLLAVLRSATEDDVIAALESGYVQLPLTKPDEVLEAVQRLVDHLFGEDET